ncbi:MAG: 50S ribosomal protein L10 [candidate division WOR-3 bacterium]
MLRSEKTKVVDALTAQLSASSALYFLSFTGVGANDTTELRRRLREQGVGMRVVKNRIALRALAAAGLSGEFAGMLKGPTAIVFASADPVAPARLLRETVRRLPGLKVKGIYLDGALHPAADFDAIASLPGIAELRAECVGVLQGTIAGLVFVLDGIIAELAYVLSAIEEKKAAPAAAV